ncbi:MAG: hypothetical protein KJ065_19335 [Anaerolineae bacterium]|nr:hypothetical protein [Anaerolineae bacterium]
MGYLQSVAAGSFAAGKVHNKEIGSILILAMPFALLLFQEARFEGYESEKSGFLIFLSLIIIASWQGKRRWRAWRLNPLVVSVLAYFVTQALSTVFSLSPTSSLWGDPQRSQGLISLCAYILLFLQCVRAGQELSQQIIPVLICVTAPICVFSIVERIGFDITRPGSTAGNPNYLSSSLILILLFLIPQVYSLRISRLPARRARFVFLALIIGLVGTALILSGSRGALVGLFGGIVVSILSFGAILRRRSYVIGAVSLLGGVVLSYGLIAAHVNPSLTDAQRIFQPTDEFRMTTWQVSQDLLRRQSKPLVSFDDQKDPRAWLRPIIGYGLETLPQLQTRLGTPYGENRYFDSTHNLVFDTLLTSGRMGLFAISAVFLSAVAWISFRLGLLSRRSVALLSVLELVCIVAGAQLAPRFLYSGDNSGLIPLGAALGAVAGIALWLIGLAFTKTRNKIEIERKHIYLIGLLSIVVAHWVDLQFGFTQHASDALWWMFLGLAAQRAESDSQVQSAEVQAHSWQLAMGISGVFVIYSFGISIQSRFVQHELASEFIPILLGVILVVGVIGLALTAKSNLSWRMILSILALWGAWAGLKSIINIFASLLDESLVTGNVSPSLLMQSLFLLSMKGWIAFALSAYWCICSFKSGLQGFRVLLIVLIGSIGLANYAVNDVASTLHALGNAFVSTQTVEGLRIAETTYELSASLAPYNYQVRIAWAGTLLAHLRSKLDRSDYPEMIQSQVLTLFQWNPYYNNSLSWGLFLREYYGLFSAQPPLVGGTT